MGYNKFNGVINMKNKDAVELSLNVIVIAAMVLIVLVVSIMIYTGYIGKTRVTLDENIYRINHDCDGDGINDAIDRCPCDAEDTNEPKKECTTSVKNCENMIKGVEGKKCLTD